MCKKIFVKKLIKKFVVHIFTRLLAPFGKLVNYSRHSEALKYVWKSKYCCDRRKMSSISEFFRMFKDSLWCESLTNLDAKGSKRRVKMWTTNSYKIFSKNILLYVHEQSAVENSFSTYVCYAPDGLFWLNLYIQHNVIVSHHCQAKP